MDGRREGRRKGAGSLSAREESRKSSFWGRGAREQSEARQGLGWLRRSPPDSSGRGTFCVFPLLPCLAQLSFSFFVSDLARVHAPARDDLQRWSPRPEPPGPAVMEATDAAYDGYWEPYEPATPPPPSPSPYPSPSPSPQSSAFLPVPVTAAAAAAVPAGQRTLRGSQSTSSLRRKLNSSRPIVPPLRSTSVPKRSPVHGGAGAPSAPNPNASTSTLPSNTSSPPNLPSQLYSTSTPPESSRFLRPRASSTASVATSNSSSCHGPPAAPPQQEGLMVGEGDSTALMIKQLYARLDAQGVPGDGWEQGMERSRDGIISREAVEGGKTVGRGMKGIVMRDSVLFPPMAAQTLRRVDRYVVVRNEAEALRSSLAVLDAGTASSQAPTPRHSLANITA